MTTQTYTVSVSGRTYFNIVLPAMQRQDIVLGVDLPSPLLVRAGRGAKAIFTELTEAQALALGEFCKTIGSSWGARMYAGMPNAEDGTPLSAASSILARVFVRDGERVLARVERQRSGTVL